MSEGVKVTGGAGVNGGLTAGADVHVVSFLPERVLVNKQLGLPSDPSRKYIWGVYGDCLDTHSCLTGTTGAYDRNGTERFSISDHGAISQADGFSVRGGVVVTDGGVRVDDGFRVSRSASVNGAAVVVGGADVSEGLTVLNGNLRVVADDIFLYGSA